MTASTHPGGSNIHGEVVRRIELGPTTWTVVADSGVVKIYSTRDGCMVALNDVEADRARIELNEAMEAAAYVVRTRTGDFR